MLSASDKFLTISRTSLPFLGKKYKNCTDLLVWKEMKLQITEGKQKNQLPGEYSSHCIDVHSSIGEPIQYVLLICIDKLIIMFMLINNK